MEAFIHYYQNLYVPGAPKVDVAGAPNAGAGDGDPNIEPPAGAKNKIVKDKHGEKSRNTSRVFILSSKSVLYIPGAVAPKPPNAGAGAGDGEPPNRELVAGATQEKKMKVRKHKIMTRNRHFKKSQNLYIPGAGAPKPPKAGAGAAVEPKIEPPAEAVIEKKGELHKLQKERVVKSHHIPGEGAPKPLNAGAGAAAGCPKSPPLGAAAEVCPNSPPLGTAAEVCPKDEPKPPPLCG